MQQKLIAGVAGVALLLSGFAFLSNPTEKVIERIVERVENNDSTLGAVPGSSLDGNEWSVGGMKEYRVGQPLASATSSVVCAIKGPSATSTLNFAGLEFTSYDFGTIEMDVSTSSTRFGSSTPALIAGAPLAEGIVKPIIWTGDNASTTAYGILGSQAQTNSTITGESAFVIGPNLWVTFRIATTASAYGWPNSAKGRCGAQFFVL